jgi:outer membrane receptor protein involved in Fe transport
MASSARAQTALLVTSETGDPEWVSRVEDAASATQWRYGVVDVLFVEPGPGSTVSALRAALGTGLNRGWAAAVLVVVSPGLPTDLGAAVQRFVAAPGPEPVPVLRVAELLEDGRDLDAVSLARAIERAATTAFALLLESGARPGAGEPGLVYRLAGINVTAFREARETFATPRPVTVVGQAAIRERAPNNAADLFRDIPGLDVEGVGANQRRPVIRGLRGQRVLLLEDGIRLNNPRRRLDSGEPPSLTGVFELDRVEVVRGASSVLYGSDAIGGVVNLIQRRPRYQATGTEIGSSLQYRFSSGDEQHRVSGVASGHAGPLSFQAGGSYREASPYKAPAGSFGGVTLASDTRVEDTGVEDYNLGGRLEYQFSAKHSIFTRFERYRAREAGFGFVDPTEFGAPGATVQILFPDLQFGRIHAGYEGLDLGQPFADRLTVTGYWQDNERDFVTKVAAPFDPAAPTGPGIRVESANFTDIETYGFRLEAARSIGGRHLLTYGADLYRDRSVNTDVRSTTVVGFGPPSTTTDSTPGVPNATLRSLGVFAQGALALGSRAELTLGVRYQDVLARTIDTPGLESLPDDNGDTDRTLVGAANFLFRASETVNLVASVGRGFRSPNLIERFFSGATPEGTGVWTRNPELGAETSLNVDVGARVQTESVYFEGFLFGNFLKNGIQLQQTDSIVDGLPVFQNGNVSRMDITGLELTLGIRLTRSFSIEGGFTHLAGSNPDDAEDPVLEGYRDRLHARLRYADSRDRFWGEYDVRHNGSTDDVVPGLSPVGDLIPSFTVHAVRGGVRLFRGQRLGIAVENLGNSLYAEPTNVAFFRPEPKRSLVLTWTAEF